MFSGSCEMSVVTWSSMTRSMLRGSVFASQDIISLYSDLQTEGMVLNVVTFACLLQERVAAIKTEIRPF